MNGIDRSLSELYVHFLLRKIFLYVWLSKNEGPIDIAKAIDKLDVKMNENG
jgi:hypothetical protein